MGLPVARSQLRWLLITTTPHFCDVRPSPFRQTLLIHPTLSVPRKTFAVSNRKMESIGNTSGCNKAKFQYYPLEDVEPIERYRPGGFHPVAIGDILHNDRYRIVHKLGFGGYSTTWLARDQTCDRYVAIKVTASDVRDDCQESEILHRLASKGGEYPGKAIISSILDEFGLTGPNGKHRCLVRVPARMSLIEAKDASYFRLFQPHVARAIIAQLVQAVDYLLTRGIVHADLHLGNILLRLPSSIDNLSPEQLYERYGRPDLEPVTRLDGRPLPAGVPTHGVITVWLGVDSEHITLPEAHIILTDFGESFALSTTERHYSNTPPLLVPPEVRFSHESLSFPVDIWALACVIWEILGQRPLFESFFPTADRITAEQVEVLGKLPPEWWERWETRLEWFTEEGEMQEKAGTQNRVRRPWEERFEYCVQEPRREKGMEVVDEEENEALFAMLKSMLIFRPQERATAREVLGSEWMRNWALPELEKMRKIQKNGH